MKTVIWTDESGKKHRSLLPDHTPEREAPSGLPQDPPPFMTLLDWEGMGITLWNLLVENGITDYQAHQRNQNLLNAAIKQAIQNPLVNLLKAETRNPATGD